MRDAIPWQQADTSVQHPVTSVSLSVYHVLFPLPDAEGTSWRFNAAAAAQTSWAPITAELTATLLIPAAITSSTFSAVMPAIAIAGILISRAVCRAYSNPSKTSRGLGRHLNVG